VSGDNLCADANSLVVNSSVAASSIYILLMRVFAPLTLTIIIFVIVLARLREVERPLDLAL
jgi:hypothetical protein